MVKIIRDLWILIADGRVLFDRVFEEKLHPDLFGSFMSAINMFAMELTGKDGISSIVIADKVYTLFKKRNMIFIGNSAKTIKEKKIIGELNKISNKFFATYPSQILEDFDGNVDIFRNFSEKIDESLEKPIDRIQKAIW